MARGRLPFTQCSPHTSALFAFHRSKPTKPGVVCHLPGCAGNKKTKVLFEQLGMVRTEQRRVAGPAHHLSLNHHSTSPSHPGWPEEVMGTTWVQSLPSFLNPSSRKPS